MSGTAPLKRQRHRETVMVALPSGPIGGIADRRFRYVPAVATDISKTFRRVRAQIAKGERL